MINKEDEAAMTRSFKEGFMEPIKELTERFKAESDLREKIAESRYSLSQKKLDIIEEKIDNVTRLIREAK